VGPVKKTSVPKQPPVIETYKPSTLTTQATKLGNYSKQPQVQVQHQINKSLGYPKQTQQQANSKLGRR
jgi:hypothetical protein